MELYSRVLKSYYPYASNSENVEITNSIFEKSPGNYILKFNSSCTDLSGSLDATYHNNALLMLGEMEDIFLTLNNTTIMNAIEDNIHLVGNDKSLDISNSSRGN